MHEKVLPKHSLDLLNRLAAVSSPALAGWTLAGGTGLSLQMGHRISEDFDFFRTDTMNLRTLHDVLRAVGPYETLQDSEHTLTVLAARTKLSFFRVPDPFIFETQPYRFFHLAHIRDIALMKLVAISGRGARKDFVDLYKILRSGPRLRDCLADLPRKYPPDRLNTYHILKSLAYFEDAEQEPMPRMLEPFEWKACKSFFIRESHAIVLR